MTKNIHFAKPNSEKANILLCIPGNPFVSQDLVNMFNDSVWHDKTTFSFMVNHYRVQDAVMPVKEEFDENDKADNIGVVVFHFDVDPNTRICQSCGKQVGTK